ncbi:hypothetical protein [uncultured Psychrosphaera sp.]|uniref:YobI family P-loop NTPase n=1 Tax=uncultured Psychrosphaera sp. TaxID=1403522 RepID=UPI0026387EE7|nr:hypothetical protein [uncultured Psychrosphaera sp.]
MTTEMDEVKNLPDLSHDNQLKVNDIQIYLDSLDEMILARDERICNIALTSSFAGGKSSIISTYLNTLGASPSVKNDSRSIDNQNKSRKIKSIEISLKTLTDVTSQKKEKKPLVEGLTGEYEHLDNCHDVDVQKIEAGILKQLLYRLGSKESRVFRNRTIFELDKISFGMWLTFILWFLSFTFVIFNPDFTLGSLLQQLTPRNTFWSGAKIVIATFLYSTFVITSAVLIKPLVNLVRQYRISHLALGAIEAEVKHNDSSQGDPDFDNHLEEIIYYFKKSKVNLVVIEDVDRFKTPSIFLKLSEINKIINDAAEIGKSVGENSLPVKFIYAIKDELFTSQDLTKLFDVIIPIVPIMSKANSYSVFETQLKLLDLHNDFGERFLRQISVYFTNPREIKQIVMEYYHYKKVVLNEPSDSNNQYESLLALMIYKVLYSEDFERLNNGKGYIAQIFRRAEIERTNIIKNINTDIEILGSELAAVRGIEQLRNYEDRLKQVYIDAIHELDLKYKTKILSINGVDTFDLSLSKIKNMNKAAYYETAFYNEPQGEVIRTPVTGDEFLNQSKVFSNQIEMFKSDLDQQIQKQNETIKGLENDLKK